MKNLSRQKKYPTGDHSISSQLEAFFSKISSDRDLQEQLYHTKEISEVSNIAKKAGYNITAAEILQAQAARIVNLPIEDLMDLAAGKKPKSGAQWGRDGKGYLDNAGVWLLQFLKWGLVEAPFKEVLSDFFDAIKKDQTLQRKLSDAKSHDDLAKMANDSGFELSGIDLVLSQAKQVLLLTEEKADLVAQGRLTDISI